RVGRENSQPPEVLGFQDGIGKEPMAQQPLPWPAFPLDHVPHEESQSDTLYLITGSSGAGKTTWCQQWVMAAQASSWRVGGLLSCPVMEGGEKVAIDLVDLTSGTRRPLAY